MLDCLRWKKNLGSARKLQGSRDPRILFANAVLLDEHIKGVSKKAKLLLVDDVTTSGGHLRACVAKLKTKGWNIELTLSGGKTIYDQNQPGFHVFEYTLENYEP